MTVAFRFPLALVAAITFLGGTTLAATEPAPGPDAVQNTAADPASAAASEPAPAEPEPGPVGNIETGRQLTYTCSGCHGIAEYKNAYPQYHVPKIAGQNETYLVNALKAYRAEERKHPTMRAQAKSFTDTDIADIAAYLASMTTERK